MALGILERAGVTPWLEPKELHKLGFSMALYPTTVPFRAAWAIDKSLEQLKAAKPCQRELRYANIRRIGRAAKGRRDRRRVLGESVAIAPAPGRTLAFSLATAVGREQAQPLMIAPHLSTPRYLAGLQCERRGLIDFLIDRLETASEALAVHRTVADG